METNEYKLKQVVVRLKLSEAEPLYSTEPITSPQKATEIMAEVLAQMDREYVCIVNLDGKNRPINYNVVSIGTICEAPASVPNIFKTAILENASGLMVFHNHPSGNVEPSRADEIMTDKLILAGNLLEIPVVDHIIIGGGSGKQYSFRENFPDRFGLEQKVKKHKAKEACR